MVWNGSSWMEVSIKEDGGNGENAVPLSNKEATGPVFKKANIWNGSSWMKVDQPEPFKKLSLNFKKPVRKMKQSTGTVEPAK